MADCNLILEDFLLTVPIWQWQEDGWLESLVDSQNWLHHAYIVLVNPQQYPIGIVSSQKLSSYLLHKSVTQKNSTAKQLINFSCSSLKLPQLIENISVISSKTTVKKFLDNSQVFCQNCQFYALVDQQKRFIGLLNLPALLQYVKSDLSPDNVTNLPVISQQLKSLLDDIDLPIKIELTRGETLYCNHAWQKYLSKTPSAKSQIQSLETNLDFPLCSIEKEDLLPVQPTLQLSSQVNNKLDFLVADSLPKTKNLLEKYNSSEKITESTEIAINQPQIISQGQKTWKFSCFNHRLNIDSSFQPIKHHQPDKYSAQLEVKIIIGWEITQQYESLSLLTAENANLKQLNRLKDEFLASLSHEIKSPMTAIIGLSNLLKEQKFGKLNPRQIHYTNLINYSSKKLMLLVNDLVDLNHLENKKIKLKLKEIDLPKLCREVIDKTLQPQGQLDTNNIRLKIQKEVRQIIADESRLKQILTHLLNNACKFPEPNYSINIEARKYKNWILLTVADTALGIPDKEQHLLFHRFQSLTTDNVEKKISSLGLIIAQKLAQAHGGDLFFTSQVEKGNKFTVILPLKTEQNNFESTTTTKGLILLVDNNIANIWQMSEDIKTIGYEVLIARSQTEAITYAKKFQPSLILIQSDLAFEPELDLITLIKNDSAIRHIPIILMNLNSFSLNVSKSGNYRTINLPISLAELADVINTNILPAQNIKILNLYYKSSQITLNFYQKLSNLGYKFIEADTLEQANLLSHVWDIDLIILDGTYLPDSLSYLQSFIEYESLVNLPLIILDKQTVTAANKLSQLNVYPFLSEINGNNTIKLIELINSIINS